VGRIEDFEAVGEGVGMIIKLESGKKVFIQYVIHGLTTGEYLFMYEENHEYFSRQEP